MKDENDKILLYLNRKLEINGSIDTQLLLSTIEFIIVPFMLEHTLCVFPGHVFNTIGFSDKLLKSSCMRNRPLGLNIFKRSKMVAKTKTSNIVQFNICIYSERPFGRIVPLQSKTMYI